MRQLSTKDQMTLKNYRSPYGLQTMSKAHTTKSVKKGPEMTNVKPGTCIIFQFFNNGIYTQNFVVTC